MAHYDRQTGEFIMILAILCFIGFITIVAIKVAKSFEEPVDTHVVECYTVPVETQTE